jgi:hypothetical protein
LSRSIKERNKKERNDEEMKYFYYLDKRRNDERGKICGRNKLTFMFFQYYPFNYI